MSHRTDDAGVIIDDIGLIQEQLSEITGLLKRIVELLEEPPEPVRATRMPTPAEICARLSKITPGEWVILKAWPMFVVPVDQSDRPMGGSADPIRDRDNYAHPIARAELHSPFEGHEAFTGRPFDARQAADNAQFIAHAPADLAFLLAEHDRLRAALESIARGDCSCGFTHCDGGCFVGRAAVALDPSAQTGVVKP